MKARARKPKIVITLDEILAKNPHLDREQILKNSQERRDRRAIGSKKRGYTLPAPYTQRRVWVNRDATDRIVTLARRLP